MSDDDLTDIVHPRRAPVIDATIVEQNISPETVLKGNERTPLGSGILVERIGTGGMAAVYKIKHPVLETFYAVKIALPEQRASHGRFISEAKITAKLDHPNIIRIREVGNWNQLPYIEMEFVEGITLREVIMQKKMLPVPIVCAIAISVVKALKYAHTKKIEIGDETFAGIIHRDLKPENIMISKTGRVVVMDFGLARPIQGSLNSTVTGCFNGTPQYAPPEQLRTEKVDQHIDIYAVGVILYEMLCGVKPFRSFDPQKDSLLTYADERATTPYIPLQKHKPGIQARFVKIVDRCINPDEAKRYDSAADLLFDLQAADTATPNRPDDIEESLASYVALINIKHAGSSEAAPTKPHRLMLTTVVGLGIIVLGIYIFLLLRTGPRDFPAQEVQGTAATEKLSIGSNAPASVQATADTTGVNNFPDAGNGLPQTPQTHTAPAASEIEKPVVEAPAAFAPVDSVDASRKKNGTDDVIAAALSAIQQSNFNDALQTLAKLPGNHPDEAKKNVLLLECYVQTGRFTDAQRIADRAGASSMESDYFMGRMQFANGAYDKAIVFFNRALLNKPQMPQRRSSFIDETLYFTARSNYQQYQSAATENNLVAAREGWRAVEQRFANRTNDRRYREAAQALVELEK